MKEEKKKKSSKESSKSPSKVLSTRERMLQRKKALESKGNGGGIIYPKEGTIRVRLMNQGPDKEIGLEVIQFYLQGVGGILSPATFGEPCPFMEKYKELKESSDEIDAKLASKLAPRRRYIVGGTLYKDTKGKEIDEDNVCKPILIPRSVYQDITDLYLDEDDWGDMTDPEEGYDIKITRSGSGKNDTTYSVSPCAGKKPINSKYYKEMDLEDIISKQILPYDELASKLDDWLNGSGSNVDDDDEEETRPVKKLSKDKKKKKSTRDI